MKVAELSLRNYRVFEEVDLELPARVIGIFGENGSGKSALMESIAFGLYGVDAARTKKQGIRTQGVLTDCEVRLVFEHGGQHYEIRRTLRGKGSTPEAELFAGDLLLASGTTDVDGEVRKLLHMDLHVFRASVFAEQKQLDAFSSMRPGERKEMALRLLGIKPIDDARSRARGEAKSKKEHAVQLAGAVADIAALEAELKGAKGAAAEARSAARERAAELKVVMARAKASRSAFESIDAARQRAEKLTVELRAKTDERARGEEQREALAARVERLRAELAELPALDEELEGLAGASGLLRAGQRLVERTEELSEIEAQLVPLTEEDAGASLDDLEAAGAELGAAQRAAAGAGARRDHASSLLETAEERLARATEADPSEPCPTCGRPLGEDFTGYLRLCKKEVTGAKAEIKEADRAVRTCASALAEADTRLRSAAEARERAQAGASKRAQLTELVASLRIEVVSLAEPFDGVVPDVAALEGRTSRAVELGRQIASLGSERKHLDQTTTDLEAAERRLDELAADLAKLAAEAEGIAFQAGEHERLRIEREEADRAFEEARDAEREASDAHKDAERVIGELEGELKQAREIAARVDEIRAEARHIERVAMLLDGFRDHLVSRIGPDLSREAEALFRELTNHEYDDLKIDEESLTIQIADGDAYHPIERFSGSESDLANLALRVAISTHLSRMSGADVGMMVLDEVLGSLDEERKDLMVQTLGRLAGRFHQLFVITHAERVKDQFPASIQVFKTGRRRSTAVLL